MVQPLILYDIPSTSPEKAWTPNLWKARLTLNAKNIPYRTVWLEYPQITGLCRRIGAGHTELRSEGPFYTCPVLQDPNTGAAVSDSLRIAKYLEETYPDTLCLLPSGTAAFQSMFAHVTYEKLTVPMFKTFIEKVVLHLNPPSSEYFRRTREEIFGMKIEEIAPHGRVRDKFWQEVLDGLHLISNWETEEKAS